MSPIDNEAVPPAEDPAQATSPGDPVSLTTPEARIEALEAEKQELRDRMLRIAAEFDNWKKRARKDQAEGEARAKEGVLRDMLDVIDNLERAVESFGVNADVQAVRQGIDLVLRLFQGKLERMDVRPLESIGQPFDPRLHDAVSKVPTADGAPGTVVAQMQKGYRIGDKLLRPAAVAVAIGLPVPPAPSGSGDEAAGS